MNSGRHHKSGGGGFFGDVVDCSFERTYNRDIMYDFEHSSDEEDRFVALGIVGDVLFVVFTERKDKIRLISARLATAKEKEIYYDRDIYY